MPLETIANILTAAVAIAAILLSVWEGMENRRHNRLSVLPHLDANELSIRNASPVTNDGFPFLQNKDSLYAISYLLENSGLGPAVIKTSWCLRAGKLFMMRSMQIARIGKEGSAAISTSFPSRLAFSTPVTNPATC